MDNIEPQKQQITSEICHAAANNWRWDGRSLATECATIFPDTFGIDRGGSRNLLWDVDYTWSYQFSKFTSWLQNIEE